MALDRNRESIAVTSTLPLLYLDLSPSSPLTACNAGFIPSPVLDYWSCSLLNVTHYSRSSRFFFTSQPNQLSISDFLGHWIRIGSRAGTLGRLSPFILFRLFFSSFSFSGNPAVPFLFRLVYITLELAIHTYFTHPGSSHTRSVFNILRSKKKRNSSIEVFHLSFSQFTLLPVATPLIAVAVISCDPLHSYF